MERLSYREFVNSVEEQLRRSTDKKLERKQITKNNGIQMDAILLLKEGEKIAPTIYLNEHYQRYLEGEELDEVVKCIRKLSEQKLEGEFHTEQFLEFTSAKQHILFKLIHAKSNENLLKEIPHRRFLDLAVVFYYLVPDEKVHGSILIRNEHMQLWEVTDDQLFNVAMKNTPEELQPEIRDMNTVVSELLEGITAFEGEELAEETAPMYVVTNKRKYYGAACMLYPGLLKTFAEMRNTDFYILPSSVHELLLIPFDLGVAEELSAMVCEVNDTQVIPEEVLSNHVYLYRRKTDEIISV